MSFVSVSLLSVWVLAFSRVGALFAALPIFALEEFPIRLRVLLAALIAMLLSPFLPIAPAEPANVLGMVRLLFMETAVGLLLGFVCRLVLFGLDMAGNVIATEMGLNMANELNPFTRSSAPIPGVLLQWLAIMLWFSLDLHHWMIAAIQRSYTLVPVGSAHLSSVLFSDVLRRTAGIFTIALEISAPVLGVSFLISLVFAMLGRAVPQMNVFTESFPVRTLAGLAVFGTTSMLMAHHILNYLRHLPEDALRVMQLLGPT